MNFRSKFPNMCTLKILFNYWISMKVNTRRLFATEDEFGDKIKKIDIILWHPRNSTKWIRFLNFMLIFSILEFWSLCILRLEPLPFIITFIEIYQLIEIFKFYVKFWNQKSHPCLKLTFVTKFFYLKQNFFLYK